MRRIVPILLSFALFTATLSTAEAGLFRNRSRRSRSTTQKTASTPRPVSGYGANFHRRTVIQQELKRAESGKSVRNRGNIMWSR